MKCNIHYDLQMEELLKLSRIEMVNIANEKCDGDTYEFMNLYFEKWIKSRMPWRVSRNFKRIQNIESLEFQYCLRLPANRLMKLLSLNDYLNIYVGNILFINKITLMKQLFMIYYKYI